MKREHIVAIVVLVSIAVAIGCVAEDMARADGTRQVSPIYGVKLPDGYRAWQLVAPALEDDPLNELRAVVGNTAAIEAYESGALPFPDGAVLVKLAWQRVQSPEFASATIPGAATTVQVMVKDSKRYAASGGWGFGRFIDGRPADEAQHANMFRVP